MYLIIPTNQLFSQHIFVLNLVALSQLV